MTRKFARVIAVLALILILGITAVIAMESYGAVSSGSSPKSLSILILSPQTDPFVDSSCLGKSSSGSSNDCSLTTTHSPDLIIAEMGTDSSGSSVSSVSDSKDLTWILYAHYTGGSKSLFVYYAFTSAVLSKDTVTVKYKSSGADGLIVMAVNNYDSKDPFDPSSSPATSSSSTATTKVQVTHVSTANPDELLLGLFAILSNPTVTGESGFTALSHSNSPTVYAEWEHLSGTASSVSVSATLSTAETYLGAAFGIVPAQTTSTTTTKSTSTVTSTTSTKTSTTSTTTLTSTSTSTSTVTTTVTSATSGSSSTVTSTSVSVSSSSTGNACFVNAYNSAIPIIDAIYWECDATLRGSQSITQNIFRSPELAGAFTLKVTSSQTVKVEIIENGVVIFSETGTNISYSGTATSSEPMSITIANSETTDTTYELSIDWTGV